MEIKKIKCGVIGTNSYLIINGNNALVIDPSDKIVYDYAAKNDLKIEAVLLTHGHFDHIAGVKYFLDDKVPVYIGAKDNAKCNGEEMSDKLSYFGIEPFNCDVLLYGGEVLYLIGLEIKVIATPGHSHGGVCYVIEDNIFSGDTLFKDTYGRFDFEDGNFQDLYNSIVNILFNLKGDFKIYPGHEKISTLNSERKGNMILWN